MSTPLTLTAREQRLTFELLEALGSSLHLQEVLSTGYSLLAQLVPMDHAALCVSRSDGQGHYDWAVADVPQDFFNAYAEIEPHDFVQRAVARRPNVVLRDSEMIPRRDLEASVMYQRVRDFHMPLEHVMSVMLRVERSWHGGLTIYRSRRRPFSDRDRALLQQLVPSLSFAVRNCKLLGQAAWTSSLLDQILQRKGAAAIVLSRAGAEVARTDAASALLERWFSPVERGAGGLPSALLEQLARMTGIPHLSPPPASPWIRAGADRDLHASFVPLPDGGGCALWALLLEEVSHAAPLPRAWAERLTPREIEVTERVLRGWDNALIADDVRCSLGTVKKHLQRVFDKLGVSSRTALLHLAGQMR